MMKEIVIGTVATAGGGGAVQMVGVHSTHILVLYSMCMILACTAHMTVITSSHTHTEQQQQQQHEVYESVLINKKATDNFHLEVT